MTGNPKIVSRKGKVARLSAQLRDDICCRIFNGESAAKLLPWLNAQPDAEKILRANFGDCWTVSDQNLSVWRRGGYQDWLARRASVERTKELAVYAAEQTRAGKTGGTASIAEGAASVAAGKLLEALEALEEEGDKPLSADALLQIAAALTALRRAEQEQAKLALEKIKIGQKDEQIALDREKYQRGTCELFLKWHAEGAALEVANSEGYNADKIERLGQIMFGETWKPARAP